MPAFLEDMPSSAPPTVPFAQIPFAQVLADCRAVIAQDLIPNVTRIDGEGYYPEAFLRRLGAAGGFAQSVPEEYGGAGRGLPYTLHLMEEVSRECLSTGFCVWCHTVCGWYLQNSDNEALKRRLLPRFALGETLAGTGMSNPMKHFAGIEKIRLLAEPRAGGYVLTGALPWVSNVAAEHVFAVAAHVAETDEYLMALVPGDLPGLSLGDGGHFIALEGSSTHNAVFDGAFLPDEFVLARPMDDYLPRIRAGFILSQCGFGLGLISACVDLMRRSDTRVGHVNKYLSDGACEIDAALETVRHSVYSLADQIGCGGSDLGSEATRAAIEARLAVSDLSLRAAQAAMLHAGAAGYRRGSTAERKLRESYFVAIVTPAAKHLRKMLHDMAA